MRLSLSKDIIYYVYMCIMCIICINVHNCKLEQKLRKKTFVPILQNRLSRNRICGFAWEIIIDGKDMEWKELWWY